jgi:hypothetical protein
MLQKLLGAGIVLMLGTGVALAQEKGKKDPGVTGQVKKVDAAAGVFTMTVRVSKTETADKEVKVGADTQVIIFVGDERKVLAGLEGLKNEQFKDGAAVTVLADGDKVTAVQVGKGAGPKAGKGSSEQMTTGKVKKVDAAAGTLTLTVRVSKTEDGDKEFKIGDATKITVFAGKEKQELTGKEGFKNENFKEGATLTIVTDKEGKVQEIRAGTLPEKGKGDGSKGEQGIKGQLKKVDATTGSLTVVRGIAVAKGQPPEQKEVEYKIDDATKVIIFSGEEKKEFTGKDGLKNEQVKDGAVVFLVMAGETKVAELRVGAPPAKKK